MSWRKYLLPYRGEKTHKSEERKISAGLGTFTMKADDTYIYYSSMGRNFRILKTDIESVSVDADDKTGIGHIGYNYLRINGKGTLLAEVHVTSGFARDAQDFILEEIKDNPKPNQSNTSNLDEIEKLSLLKDKGILTQEEFDAKKKQLLGL